MPYEPVASDALTALLVQARRAKFARDKSVNPRGREGASGQEKLGWGHRRRAPFEVANDYSLNQLLADARQEKVNLYWAERDRQTAVRISGSTTPQVGMTEEQVIRLCDSRRAHLASYPLAPPRGSKKTTMAIRFFPERTSLRCMPKGVTKRARKRAHELAQRTFVLSTNAWCGNANIHTGRLSLSPPPCIWASVSQT